MSDNKKPSGATPANPLWGGRFAEGPAAIMEMINASVGFDHRLAQQDIRGSKAHAAMLVAQGILTSQHGTAIADGLDQISAEIASGAFHFDPALEDVHMNIEARLTELIGDAAGRLHTARSRNDQVATDMRLWVRDTIDAIDGEIQALQAALIDQGRAPCRDHPARFHAPAAGPSRSLSVITCWPMSRCWAATAVVLTIPVSD